MDRVSAYMEVAVGISIMVIGASGIRESRDWARDVDACVIDDSGEMTGEYIGRAGAPDMFVTEPEVDEMSCGERPPVQDLSRTLLNGVLNGVSGTGHMLGVMPALLMTDWSVASAYLSCFGLGTFLTMAVFTGVVGELSSTLGTTLNRPGAPATLAMVASVAALLMGSVWTTRALVALGVLPAIGAGFAGRWALMMRVVR